MSASHRVISAAAALGLLAGLAAGAAAAELRLPRVSPKASVTQTLGLTDVTVAYSRPGVKGRQIWGALVPYDKPWRTGANEATTFSCSDDILVEGKKLAAGTYSLFTIPGRETWTVVFNKGKDLWGAFDYKPGLDVLRVTVKPKAAPHEEWLDIDFANLTPNSGQLQISWAELMVPITIETNAVAKALASARAAIAAAKPNDWQTPYRSAEYCFGNSVSIPEAENWLEKSIAIEENFYNISLKAKMRAKAGKTREAIELGQRAVQLGRESKDSHMDTAAIEALVAEWSAKVN